MPSFPTQPHKAMSTLGSTTQRRQGLIFLLIGNNCCRQFYALILFSIHWFVSAYCSFPWRWKVPGFCDSLSYSHTMQGYSHVCITQSLFDVSLLLMTKRRQEPKHQQSWYQFDMMWIIWNVHSNATACGPIFCISKLIRNVNNNSK